jgi:hypothetical protein
MRRVLLRVDFLFHFSWPRHWPFNLGFMIVVSTTTMHAVVRAGHLASEPQASYYDNFAAFGHIFKTLVCHPSPNGIS